jgi:hypothetical protein
MNKGITPETLNTKELRDVIYSQDVIEVFLRCVRIALLEVESGRDRLEGDLLKMVKNLSKNDFKIFVQGFVGGSELASTPEKSQIEALDKKSFFNFLLALGIDEKRLMLAL